MWKHSDLSIFARASVCNVFLAVKIFYVLQVTHCAQRSVQRLHRVFALFIWLKGTSRCGVTICFKASSVEDWVSRICLCRSSLRFLFLRVQQHPFLRAFIETALSRWLPNFVISSFEAASIRPTPGSSHRALCITKLTWLMTERQWKTRRG